MRLISLVKRKQGLVYLKNIVIPFVNEILYNQIKAAAGRQGQIQPGATNRQSGPDSIPMPPPALGRCFCWADTVNCSYLGKEPAVQVGSFVHLGVGFTALINESKEHFRKASPTWETTSFKSRGAAQGLSATAASGSSSS